MKFNKSTFQTLLKDFPGGKWASTLNAMHSAKRYLDLKNIWKSIQEQNLKEILGYAQKHCSYYQGLYDMTPEDNPKIILGHLPLLDKDKIHKAGQLIYSDVITDDWTKCVDVYDGADISLRFPELYVGKPWKAICQMMLCQKMGYKAGDAIVSFSRKSISEELLSQHLYWSKETDFPWENLYFSASHISTDTIGNYWGKLLEVKAKIIKGSPSAILKFCRVARQQGLSPSFKVKGICLAGELFTQEEKSEISDFFNTPVVYGLYCHQESSIFAVQAYNIEEYICNPLYGYTEVLDENGKQVGIDEMGEIVVTGFIEHGLPFIRYKTGDLAIYGGETEYGEAILRKITIRNVSHR